MIRKRSLKDLDDETAEWLGRPADPPLRALARGGEQFQIAQQLVGFNAPASFIADQYRTVRHTVDRWRRDNGLSVLAVTSSVPGDGKSVTALNLAATLAQTPHARVLIVDADLRRPSVGRYLGLNELASAGLSGAILDPSWDLKQVTIRVDQFNLSIVPAGPPPNDPYELLTSPRLESLLGEARRLYDCVVIDTPPLLPFPDSRALARWVDGYVMIVGAHKTPRKLVREALSLLDRKKLIGIVFNGDDRPRSTHYGYYGYYGPSGKDRTPAW